ncbi:MAG: RNA polymerase sigma factor [Planctomycetes bacterium]|nr:RNA polymerase sigma factor [Planctomycetota bacterium]
MGSPSGSDPGADLMVRYQRGDESAFRRIVELYEGTVFNLLFRFTGSREGLEDLAQEIFLRVVRARGRYRPKAKFSTFLYRVAFNLCVNEGRSRRKLRLASLDAPSPSGDRSPRADLPDPRARPPHEAVEHEEMARRLRSILDTLPETQRMALVMNKYHDLSYREIAEALGSTEKAVKSLLARARRSVRERLAPYLGGEIPA